jgi:uncharacterized membrane protein YdjX (TVP38/TMEM64 family)
MTRAWRYLPIAMVAALAIAAVSSGALHDLTFSSLQAHHAALARFVRGHRLESLAIYFLVEVLVMAACIPGPGLMSVAAGFLFGALLGGAACLAAGVVGSLVVYFACRTAFSDALARRAGAGVGRITQLLRQNAFASLLTLRLMPIMPVMVVNIAGGLARAPAASFLAASAIGGAPVSFVLAALGAGLQPLFARGAPVDAHLLASPRILWPLALLAALSAGPLIVRLMRQRRNVSDPA